MSNILVISYYFPPIRSAEGAMAANCIKTLSKFGCNAVVICGKPSKAKAMENSSIANIGSNIKVYRVNSIENVFVDLLVKFNIIPKYSPNMSHVVKNEAPKVRMRRISQVANNLKILPSRIFGWVPFVVIYSSIILKKNNIQLIQSRSAPISSHIAGLILKYLSGLPWIVCLSDPWTTDPNLPYKKKILPENVIKKYDEYLEKKIILNSDKVIVTTENLKKEYIEKFKTISKDKIVVIPNSFDSEWIKTTENGYELNNIFTITYAGTFANTRTPESFFKALRNIEDGCNEYKIKVKFIGHLGVFEQLITKYKLEDVIEVIGEIPHETVIGHLKSADVLLLIDAPNHTMCLPSKLVEYIFIGKPILAITPEIGCSADVIKTTKTGIIIPPQDIEGIENAIKSLYRDYKNGSLDTKPDWDEINKYSAENCTKTLVEIIESLID